MKTVDLSKEVFDRVTGMGVRPYLSSAVATGLSWAVAGAYTETWRDRLELTGAVAGTAALLHEGYAALSSTTERNRTLVIGGAAGRRVQRMPPL